MARRSLALLWSLGAVLLGLAVIQVAVVALFVPIATLGFGITGFPETLSSRLVLLACEVVSGAAGGFAVTAAAPGRSGRHAVVLGVLVTLLDALIVFEPGGPWPLWLGVAVVLTVPFQVWLGYLIVRRARWVRGHRPRPPHAVPPPAPDAGGAPRPDPDGGER